MRPTAPNILLASAMLTVVDGGVLVEPAPPFAGTFFAWEGFDELDVDLDTVAGLGFLVAFPAAVLTDV